MTENIYTKDQLRIYQALPLDVKIGMTQQRIREWYNHYGGAVCVSFSGGKDSTVLLHIIRKMYPEVKAVFCNTGLEFPEIQNFAKSFGNTDVIRPEMRFDEVISTYGYPLISKEVADSIYYARRISKPDDKRKFARQDENGSRLHELINTSASASRRTELSGKLETSVSDGNDSKKLVSMYNKSVYKNIATKLPAAVSDLCCNVMKKKPLKKYQRKSGLYPFVATMASESMARTRAWLKTGCNVYAKGNVKSQPISFWTDQDVLQYAINNGIKIASVYGDIVAIDEFGTIYDPNALLSSGCTLKCSGCNRTGCIFCAFGLQNDKGETRFQMLSKTHPRQYEYCIEGGQWVDNPKYDPTAPKMDGDWENWNPKKIWVPSKKGLGMGKVFDMVNEIMGKDFYRYK